MESARAEKESQIEEGTDAIDETAGKEQDTKSAEMTAISMHSGDGASGAHVEAMTFNASSRSAFVLPRGAKNNNHGEDDWAQLGEKNQGAVAQRN